jgi:hypothetical protein
MGTPPDALLGLSPTDLELLAGILAKLEPAD